MILYQGGNDNTLKTEDVKRWWSHSEKHSLMNVQGDKLGRRINTGN